MRTLPGSMSTNVAKTFTDPVYLLELELSTMTYWSSRETIAYDSGGGLNNYLKDRLDAVAIRDEGASFRLANDDRYVSAAALSGQVRGNSVRLFLYYEGDAILRHVGEINSLSMSDDDSGSWIAFDSTSISALEAQWPRVRIAPALGLNHLPQPGLSFQFGTNLYTLERSNT